MPSLGTSTPHSSCRRRPFSQLMIVTAFVKKDDRAKQVSLPFLLMSGRRKSDYRKGFEELLEILPSAPKVQQITLDFENATWAALRKVLPRPKLHGCVQLDGTSLEEGDMRPCSALGSTAALESNRLDVVQAGQSNKQRRRGLAP